jgi:hypothetical protein
MAEPGGVPFEAVEREVARRARRQRARR